MTPEAQARQIIDSKLVQAGWIVQDHKAINLGAGPGVAVREFPTDSGPADYLLFVQRQAVGVIEAKRDDAGATLVATERQTARYATARLKWRREGAPLRFLFEATGQIIRFTDTADPAPRSRECSISSGPRRWPTGRRGAIPCAAAWSRRCPRCRPRSCATARSAR